MSVNNWERIFSNYFYDEYSQYAFCLLKYISKRCMIMNDVAIIDDERVLFDNGDSDSSSTCYTYQAQTFEGAA